MLRNLFMGAVALISFQAAALSSPWDVASVSITKVGQETAALPNLVNDCSKLNTVSPLDDGGLGGLPLDQIITVGEKLWTIVEAGKPVVNVNTPPTAAALPRGLECWNELSNWQPSQTETYDVSYKNGFGMEVVKFRFRLAYTAGGSVHGHGKYLANVSVLPAELNVIWGYTFDANVAVADAVNLGSLDEPMAGLELTVNWTVKTVLKESVNSFHYFVQGDGQVKAAN